MRKNVGNTDRYARFLLGIGLMVLPFISSIEFFQEALGTTIALAVGLVLVVTASLRVCPLYSLLGIGRRKRKA